MSLNAIHCWAIITKNYKKTFDIFNSIKKKQENKKDFMLCNNGTVLYFKSGLQVRWIEPTNGCRGYRFHRLWCDKDISQDYFEQVILPMACYMKYEDIIWI